MSARASRRAKKKLNQRRQDYERVPIHLKAGFRRPGSQNPRR